MEPPRGDHARAGARARRPLGAPEALLDLGEAEFCRRFRASALSRTKRSGLRRNAALWLGNRRHAESAPALERALSDGDGVVQRAARWARDRIR